MSVENLITKHIDIWTSAVQTKSTAGRGTSSKLNLYGIKKLRELILELAFSGKLVENDIEPVDLPKLIGDMKKERQAYHDKKGVRIQNFKELPDTKLEFNLPSVWGCATFNDIITYITDFQANGSFSSIKQNVLYYDAPNYAMLLRLTDLRHGLTDASSYKYTDKKGYNFLAKSSVHGGELVVANVGAGVGTTLEVPDINMPTTLAPNMFMVVLSKEINKSYFLYFCQSTKYLNYIDMVNTGTGQPKINKTEYKNCQIPLPSIDEQHRIVAKIDELMVFCDQLEQQTETSIEAHQVLVETLLATLTNSANADELMENWERISAHFDTLFTTEDSIDQLKQTILQLAVMGKLVPQNPKDEPASVLLERIAKEKAQLVKDKKIKKQKALPPITGDEKPFELPNGWEWCRTVDAGDIKLGRQRSPKDHTGPYMTPYLRVANVHDNRIDTTDIKKMNFTPEEQKIFRLEYGDILLNEGQSKELVGRPAIYRDEVPGACFQNTLLRFKVWEGVSAEYSLLYFRYCLYSGRFQRAVKQTTNMAHLSAARLIPIEFPLPPKEEQARIVAKVNELTGICEQLKVCLKESQATQLHLTDVIVEQAV